MFFLGTRSHKPVMFNTLRERFKMADNRKLIDIDAKHNVFVSYNMSRDITIALLVTNLSGKIVNFC